MIEENTDHCFNHTDWSDDTPSSMIDGNDAIYVEDDESDKIHSESVEEVDGGVSMVSQPLNDCSLVKSKAPPLSKVL